MGHYVSKSRINFSCLEYSHKFEQFVHDLASLDPIILNFVETTVIASLSAIFFDVIFTHVDQDLLSFALKRLSAKFEHFVDVSHILIFPVLFCMVVWILDEPIKHLSVLVFINQYTMSLFPISSSSSAFLDIPFNTFRHRFMHNKPNVFFIDAKPKRNSSNNDIKLAFHPLLLNICSFFRVYSSVIEMASKPYLEQLPAESLGGSLGNTINNSTLSFKLLIEVLPNFYVFEIFVYDRICQIWAVKW